MGRRMVPFEIQAEWVAYQQIFGAQLEQMSAYLARSAKAEKSRLKAMAADLGVATEQIPNIPELDDHDARKAAVRSKVSKMRLAPGVMRITDHTQEGSG